MAEGVAEGAGEGGQASVEGGPAEACGELAGDEGGDVPVSELVQLQGPEGGDEIVVDVVPVARDGGLECEGLGGEPGGQVVVDALVRVGVEPAGLALQEPPQRLLGRVVAAESATAHGRPAVARCRDVDRERPRRVVTVSEQVGQWAPSW
ncbi:hypothetical protein [Streptomyces sp. AP-93]|uniref:hypothetical protein n=1 Tax=Streptomyces sp. AP-93 TaxID=2929048 RepID=UPI001FAE8FD0|nr:hypothetical protein [Streptomyces sp. AP-93]MCJ0874242.1 hypothetical protein [Streptomyces sp. AP-93]